MEFRIFDRIEPIAHEWDELATRVHARPFLRPGWFDAWWRSFGRGRLEIVTLRREGRLAGVAPLYRRRGTLLSVANVHSPAFAPLAEDEVALRELAGHVYECDPMHTAICSVEAGTPEAGALERAARARGRLAFTVLVQSSPYVEVDSDWHAFEKQLSGKFVSDLRRRRRLLEREGEVELDVRDGSAERERLLEELFRVEPSGWKDRRGTAIVSSPQTRRFYEEVAVWAAPRGSLRLAFLRLNGQVLAAEYALEDDRSYYLLKGGFDRQYARFAPAKLLAHAMIERAFATGLRSFEFLGVAEPWKLDWRPAYRDVVLQHSFLRTPAGAGLYSAVAAWRLGGRPLAKRVLPRARG